MTLTELIAALEAVRAEHGDLEVVTFPCGLAAEPTVKVQEPDWRQDYDLGTPNVVTLD